MCPQKFHQPCIRLHAVLLSDNSSTGCQLTLIVMQPCFALTADNHIPAANAGRKASDRHDPPVHKADAHHPRPACLGWGRFRP